MNIERARLRLFAAVCGLTGQQPPNIIFRNVLGTSTRKRQGNHGTPQPASTRRGGLREADTRSMLRQSRLHQLSVNDIAVSNSCPTGADNNYNSQ
jgi:hypothetical protein